jgi:hypothetical protein
MLVFAGSDGGATGLGVGALSTNLLRVVTPLVRTD